MNVAAEILHVRKQKGLKFQSEISETQSTHTHTHTKARGLILYEY